MNSDLEVVVIWKCMDPTFIYKLTENIWPNKDYSQQHGHHHHFRSGLSFDADPGLRARQMKQLRESRSRHLYNLDDIHDDEICVNSFEQVIINFHTDGVVPLMGIPPKAPDFSLAKPLPRK